VLADAPAAPLVEVARWLERGDPQRALARCAELLGADDLPSWLVADVCNLAGTAAHALGQASMAETLWRQAVAQAEGDAAAGPLFNLAVLLAAQRRDVDAIACCRDVLALDPGQPAASMQLAALLTGHGGVREAEDLYRAALREHPDNAAVLADLGVLLAGQRRHAEAEAAYRRALALDPANATVHTNLGVLLADLQRPVDAEACHRRALELAPDDASALSNLGLLLQSQRRYDAAESCQRRALALAPDAPEIHTNLGNLLAERGDPRDAESHLRRALELAPDSAAARLNLGVFCAHEGRDAEAEACLRAAIALRPAYPLAQLNLSRLLLAQARFEEGWRLHEARYDPALHDNGISPPDLALPAWRGEPLAGRSLLVWPEQGFGDQIQFCRYVPWLKRQGAAHVTLVCQRPLATLFASLPGVDAIVAADVVDNAFQAPGADLSGHDFWTFPLSLPRLAGTDLSTLPAAPIPYLRSAPALGAAWAARWRAAEALDVGTRALRVGLVWRGNPRHDNDADRSLQSLETLAPLWSVPGVRFASLQAGRAPTGGGALLDWGGLLRDFADTAAALDQLDLLICVDTSIAHLAGALGVPCWVLLPQHRTDWRWLRERADSPWYPTGMRLFRQPRRGAWAPVVEQVRAALLQRALEPHR